MSGRTLGGELSIFLRPLDHWRVGLGYSLFDMDLDVDSGSTDTLASGVENDDPHQLAFVKSHMNLTKRLQFDQLASYTDDQRGLGLHGYTRLDLAVRYRLSDEVEVSIVGQNLVKDHQLQFTGSTGESATEVPRGVYFQFAARF